jgi:MscS family membrane protein
MRAAEWMVVAVCMLGCSVGSAPAQTATVQTPAPAAQPPPAPGDPLGRSTPRGTVLGFLEAARADQYDVARLYLHTGAEREAAETLARQLFAVLDARLPARLTQISDTPDGSRASPRTPERERIGSIHGKSGEVEVLVERVPTGAAGPIWLFSSATLEAVPRLHDEVTAGQGADALPAFLTNRRIAGVRLFEWVAVALSIPGFYLATVLLNRGLLLLTGPGWRRVFGDSSPMRRNVLPMPARLLLVALAGRWALSYLPVSLLVRQFWSSAAGLIAIVASVWLLVLLNREIERYIRHHVPRANVPAAVSLLRVARRGADLLAIFLGLLVMFRRFGIDPTPALAGLGVGGIAVALAAQKTLENIVAGASLIFDQAVRVGDFLKVGEITGTVDHIGLRSTRIRTLDRTVVSVPNAQIASTTLETISARDKFWFHPVIGLRFETTTRQLHDVVAGIRRALDGHASVDAESVRVRFVRVGSFSLDVEVFAYFFASDWNHFLAIQEELLFEITGIVERAGAAIALPSQTTYVAQPEAAIDSLRSR